MATQTKAVVSNTVTTYTITDLEGSSVLITRTQGYGSGITLTFASTGQLHVDGQAMMTTLMELLSTGLAP